MYGPAKIFWSDGYSRAPIEIWPGQSMQLCPAKWIKCSVEFGFLSEFRPLIRMTNFIVLLVSDSFRNLVVFEMSLTEFPFCFLLGPVMYLFFDFLNFIEQNTLAKWIYYLIFTLNLNVSTACLFNWFYPFEAVFLTELTIFIVIFCIDGWIHSHLI